MRRMANDRWEANGAGHAIDRPFTVLATYSVDVQAYSVREDGSGTHPSTSSQVSQVN